MSGPRAVGNATDKDRTLRSASLTGGAETAGAELSLPRAACSEWPESARSHAVLRISDTLAFSSIEKYQYLVQPNPMSPVSARLLGHARCNPKPSTPSSARLRRSRFRAALAILLSRSPNACV